MRTFRLNLMIAQLFALTFALCLVVVVGSGALQSLRHDMLDGSTGHGGSPLGHVVAKILPEADKDSPVHKRESLPRP